MENKGSILYEIPNKLFVSKKKRELLEISIELFVIIIGWLLVVYIYIAEPDKLIVVLVPVIMVSFLLYLIWKRIKYIKSYVKFQIYSTGVLLPWNHGIFIPFANIKYVRIRKTAKQKKKYLEIVKARGEIEEIYSKDCGNIDEVVQNLSKLVEVKDDA